MLWAAFITGLAGGLHCAGMCSPLVMVVTHRKKSVMINKLIYNAGRIMMYGVMGAIAGTISVVMDLSFLQKFLSISVAVVLLLMGLSDIQHIRIPGITTLLQKITLQLKVWFSKWLNKKNKVSVLVLGFLNGLLPCGLTYLALSFSVTAQNMLEGFLYMVVFGAGTLPVMLGLPVVLQFLAARIHFNVRKFGAILFIAMGALLLARNFTFLHSHEHNVVNSSEYQEPTLCQ